MQRNEKRSINCPGAKVPTTPPTCSMATDSGGDRDRCAEIVEDGRQPARQQIEIEQAHEEHDPEQQRCRSAVLGEEVRDGQAGQFGFMHVRVGSSREAGGRSDPASSSATRALSRPVKARKRMDPGSNFASTGTKTIGTMPPTRKTERQPNAGMRAAATSPPSAAPTEKPTNMVMTMVARRRCGLNSDVSATALGIAPPRPRPVRKRSATSQSDVLRDNHQQGADAKGQGAENDDALAPDAVSYGTENERAAHQAEQAGAEHRPRRAARGKFQSRARSGAT